MIPDDEASRTDAAIGEIDWRALPPESVKTAFAAPSGNLAFVSMGPPDGRRVVLVPGVTGSKEDFTLMLPGLAAAGYLVESFDIAGQYESAQAGPDRAESRNARYDYDLFVDDLIAVLEAGRRPVHVLGYSFAGVVAQLALQRRPDLFASLSLLSCPPRPGQAFRGVKRIGWLSQLASARLGATLMIWGIRLNVVPASASRLRFVKHRLAYTNRRSVSDVIRLMKHTPDLRTVLAETPIPKFVAVGAHDLWPIVQHEEFARAIGADFAVYTTGHSPCETTPNQLNRDVLAMFATVDSPGGP